MGKYFLFARPNFWGGMARVLDLGCTLNEYNYSINTEKADFYALHSDWKTVGIDFLTAMEKHKDEIATHGED